MKTIIRTQVIFTVGLLALPFSAEQALAQSCVPGLGMSTSDLLFGVRRPAPSLADFTTVTVNTSAYAISPVAILGVSANHAYVIDGTTTSGGHVLFLTYTPATAFSPGSLSGSPVNIGGVITAMAIAWDGTYLWGVSSSGAFGNSSGFSAVGSVNATPTKMIFDGNNLWIGTTKGTLYRVQIKGVPAPVITPVVLPQNVSIGGLTFDGQYVWAAAVSGGLYRVDPSTLVFTVKYIGNGGVVGGPIVFDGYSIWATGVPGAASVTRFNAVTGAVTGSYPASDARSLFFDGSQIWVANRSANSLTPIRACDGGSSLSPFSTQAYPDNVGFDGTNLWVTSSTSRTISIR